MRTVTLNTEEEMVGKRVGTFTLVSKSSTTPELMRTAVYVQNATS